MSLLPTVLLFLLLLIPKGIAQSTVPDKPPGPSEEVSCAPCDCVVDDNASSDGGKIKADCSHRNLKAIPESLPSFITSLKFDDNELVSFKEDEGICDARQELKSLSLARNALKRLPRIFKGCSLTLEEIDVSGNSLTQISAEDFSHLGGLRTLKGLTVSGDLARAYFTPLKNLRRLEISSDAVELPVDMFADMEHLNTLRLELNILGTISDAPLKIPALTTFYLKAQRLRTLPGQFLSDLTNVHSLELDLPVLDALEWPAGQQPFSSLKHLTIHGVQTVTGDTLSGMTSLQTLRLVGIWDLKDPALFQHQSRLEVLEITACHIKTLQSSWFSGLKELSELNLTNDRISRLDPKALIGLSKLKNLILTKNRIREIPAGFLDPVAPSLDVLMLNDNALSTLETASFPPEMPSLKALVVSHNFLSVFDLDCTKTMAGLLHLYLQENALYELTGRLVDGVRAVNVSYNSLQQLPPGLMVGSLTDLDLSGNPMGRGLPVEDIAALDHLKELTIDGLTVVCDCPLQRLVRSTAVYGGQCAAVGTGNRSGGSVGDILNDPTLCPEAKPLATDVTGTSVGSSSSISERSLDGMAAAGQQEADDDDDEEDNPEISRNLFTLGNSGIEDDKNGEEEEEKDSSLEDDDSNSSVADDSVGEIDDKDVDDDKAGGAKSPSDDNEGLAQEEDNIVNNNNGTGGNGGNGLQPTSREGEDTDTYGEDDDEEEEAGAATTATDRHSTTTTFEDLKTTPTTTETGNQTLPRMTAIGDNNNETRGIIGTSTNTIPTTTTAAIAVGDQVPPGSVEVPADKVETDAGPQRPPAYTEDDKDDGDSEPSDEHSTLTIVCPIVALGIFAAVCICAALLRRMRTRGSHDLHRRRRMTTMTDDDDDDSEGSSSNSSGPKIVLTELGKTHEGHEVIVM